MKTVGYYVVKQAKMWYGWRTVEFSSIWPDLENACKVANHWNSTNNSVYFKGAVRKCRYIVQESK